MYNMADSTWKDQPKLMSIETFTALVRRVREHIVSHSLKDLVFVLHGGEPLLLGAKRLDQYLSIFWEIISPLDIQVNLGMQSNGLLLTEEIGKILEKHHATVGVSIDGIPGKGDLERVDHQGRPSGAKLEKVLRAFLKTKYRAQFTGFIAVPNINEDPRETYRYLASFDPPSIDFRLPLNHHDNPPKRHYPPESNAEYGRWYADVFDELMKSDGKLSIRFLSAIVHGLTDQPTSELFWGNTELNVIVVEADGSYELVDNLKAIANGLTKTGLNLRDHTLDDFVRFRNGWIKDVQLDEDPPDCKTCPLYNGCRGCYYISRFSSAAGFRKPSVYCSDMKHLVPLMHARLAEQL